MFHYRSRLIAGVLMILLASGVLHPRMGVAEQSDELSLYDNNGRAVAYIAVDDGLTIYLWGGQPVAYVDGENIYGFNGKHLGWFLEGAVLDHAGNVPCMLKDSYPGYTQYESYKGYKRYKPYKSYKQYAPYKPYASNRLSSTPCAIFLGAGR